MKLFSSPHFLRSHSLCLRKKQSGFTLLELLVAIGIFALLAAMAYGGLNNVMIARQITMQHAERLSQLQMAFLWLGRDIEQAIDRPIRDEFGDPQKAMLGVETGRYQLELTRTGWRNPAGRTRSNLQRVAYGVRDGNLLRIYWSVLDRAQDSEPLESIMLDGVEKLELRFLNEQNKWQNSWPSRQLGSAASTAPPRAVEVTLETRDEGRITRLFRVPGG